VFPESSGRRKRATAGSAKEQERSGASREFI
jgi:hypothetical protein